VITQVELWLIKVRLFTYVYRPYDLYKLTIIYYYNGSTVLL